MSKAKNRFNVQVVFVDGASIGIENRKDIPMTRQMVIDALKGFIAVVEKHDEAPEVVDRGERR